MVTADVFPLDIAHRLILLILMHLIYIVVIVVVVEEQKDRSCSAFVETNTHFVDELILNTPHMHYYDNPHEIK